MRNHRVGDRVLVKLSAGRIVEATIKAIVDTTEGVRLQVSFGHETALICGKSSKPKHAVGPQILVWLSLPQG
jgi:hypothetical protein